MLKIFRWTLAAVVCLVALALAFVAYELSWTPRYGDADRRYQTVKAPIDGIRQSFEVGEGKAPEIDLSSLNGGDWAWACVFGGYNQPLETMEKLDAKVSAEDRRRLDELDERGFRFSQVEEFELMIAFVDREGLAHFPLFSTGVGSGGQHLMKCTDRTHMMIDPSDA